MRISVFGFLGDGGGRSPVDRYVEHLRRVRDEGFTRLWTAQLPHEPDLRTSMAVAVREIDGIEVATGVLPIQVQHPMALAQRALTVNLISGGRLVPPWAETVSLIYDETDGLGVYFDLHLVEEAFTDPELTREKLYRQTLKDFLRDESLSPVPLIRLAERDHDAADRVFRLLLGKPRFSWAADGEALLRKHKPGWYERPPQPSISVIGDRLAPYAKQT